MKTQSLQSSLFIIALLCVGAFFATTDVVNAAPGDVRVTVTRQGDDGVLDGALVEIKCSGGEYTAFDGSPLTDGSGQVMGTPPAGANCDHDEETINARVSLVNYVTKNNESGPIQSWSAASDPNEINLTGVEFGLAVYVADQFGNAIDTLDTLTYNDSPYTLQDPVETNLFYWADTVTNNRELLIEKDGYVTFSTTNSGGTSISTTQTEQVLITLADVTNCTDPIITAVNCRGLEFGYVIGRAQQELGTNLSGVSVTAGEASCVEDSLSWYCPISLMTISPPDSYTAEKDGYVTKTFAGGVWGDTPRSANADPQVTLPNITGLQFSHKFITKDELGNNLTLNSATAGASNTACVISTNNVYCAVLLADDNTVANGLVGAKTGYVTTTAANVPLAGNRTAHANAQQVTTMTTANGLDFSLRIDVVENEIGQNIMPTSGTPWTASAGLTVATQTYDTNKWYLAASGNGNLAFVRDGYVQANITSAPTSVSQTVSTVDFIDVEFSYKLTAITAEALLTNITASATTVEVGDNTGRNACSLSGGAWYCPVVLANSNGALIARVVADGYVESLALPLTTATTRVAHDALQLSDTVAGVQYAVKATVTKQSDASALSGGTVTSGDALAIVCSEDGATGIYYCPVPVAHTDVVVSAAKTGFTTNTGTFSDRTASTDAQQTTSIALAIVVVSSGGGSGIPITGGATGFATTPPTTNPTTPTSPEPVKTDIVSRIKSEAELIFSQTKPLEFYLNTGTESTLRLGAGERGASVSSFEEAFARKPASLADWNDVLNIANGRWPIGVVKTVEARAYTNFRLVYGRNADMKNSTDVNALKMMGYGVMYNGARDLNIERRAIGRFIETFGFGPRIARHWNIIRAIAYSGVIK